MGWTETSAIHRKANGQADVKAELDAIYTWADNIHKSKVLKSQIVRGIAQYVKRRVLTLLFSCLTCCFSSVLAQHCAILVVHQVGNR